MITTGKGVKKKYKKVPYNQVKCIVFNPVMKQTERVKKRKLGGSRSIFRRRRK